MKERYRKQRKRRIIIAAVIVAAAAIGAAVFYYLTTPQITLRGDRVMEVTMKDGYHEPGAEAKFSFKDISKHVEINSRVNDDKVGTYTVTYHVEYLGKTADKERTVSVVDKEPPEITLLGGSETGSQNSGASAGQGTIEIRPGQKFTDPGASAIDDSDGDVTAQITAKGFVDIYNKGSYEIEYTVSDSYGNVGKAIRTVTVAGEPLDMEKKTIYLTFDDGPSTEVTSEILDVLKKEKVPATFFIIDYGNDQEKLALLKRALKQGCTIGIHGYSHDYSKIYSSVPAFMDNITTLQAKVKTDLGYDAFVMRFPGGSSNTVSKEYRKGIMTKLVKRVQKEGYMYNDWNVDSTDAEGNNIAVSTLVGNVMEECDPENYNVILMHDSDAKGTTAKALPKIIKWAKEEGYKFKAMKPGCPTIHHGVNN